MCEWFEVVLTQTCNTIYTLIVARSLNEIKTHPQSRFKVFSFFLNLDLRFSAEGRRFLVLGCMCVGKYRQSDWLFT